jgi:hypothetical protein
MSVASDSPGQPLRVGLLVDSFTQPNWVFKVIEDVQSSPFAQICLIIKNETAIQPQRRLRSYWKNRKYLLYALYNRLDERIPLAEENAFEEMDVRELLSSCSVIGVEPETKQYSDWFREDDVKQICAYDLDVAIAFGFRILRGEALRIAKHGVWSYHHGDNLVNRGGPAGFWEVMEASTITGSVLQVLSEDLDNGIVIHRSWTRTSDKFSVQGNRNNLYWKSSTFVMRKLKQLSEVGSVESEDANLYRPYYNRLYKMPTNSQLLPKLFKLSLTYAATKLAHSFFFDQWSLAYRFRTTADDPNNSFYRFKYLIPPKDRFWADPFPVKWRGKYFVFFEEFLYLEDKAHISVLELSKSGSTDPTVVLKLDYHLSYPFVFSWNDRYFMIPETASNLNIELYSCESFPSHWRLEAVLMEGVKAKDATLFEADGLWWMFVAMADTMFSDELHAYYSETPLGPWKAHKKNPVKSDVRNSRPAGRLFTWKGELYRPAQDSSKHYGYAITINKVVLLTPDDFIEQEVAKVLPQWRKDLRGTHTLNRCEDLTVIDCLMHRRR